MKHASLKAAKAAGAVKYYTGKPCKWGHLAERYTVSGGCCECLNEANGKGKDEASVALRDHRAARAEAMDLIPDQYLRAHLVDVAKLQAMATLFCLSKAPSLTPADVRSRKPAKRVEAGCGMYPFRFPVDCLATMQGYANQLFGSHVDPRMLELTRSYALRGATEIALEDRPAAPDWTFA